MASSQQITDRVRRLYVDRLDGRGKKIRKSVQERNWVALREEIRHLHISAASFGFADLSEIAGRAEATIETTYRTRMPLDPNLQKDIEELLRRIESLLLERSLQRSTVL